MNNQNRPHGPAHYAPRFPLSRSVSRRPEAAARAVVSHYRPTVSAHRNGWAFWTVTATHIPLQNIRYQSA
jgi:hypothetical protein